MKRIFTFGCSYTSYGYPTWADITIYNSKLKGYNFGWSGIGNYGIYNLLIQANIKYKFRNTDIILVQWTSFDREDRLDNEGAWLAGGSVYNNPNYDRKFVKQHVTFQDSLVKNYTAIISANQLFPKIINLRAGPWWIHTNNLDTMFWHYGNDTASKEIFSFYKNSLPKKTLHLPEGYECFKKDGHPDVNSHLNWAKLVSNKTKIPITNNTLKHYTAVQEWIEKRDLDSIGVDIQKITKHRELRTNLWNKSANKQEVN